MTPLEWALLAAIVGVGGYAGYKHYHPTPAAGSAGTTQTTPNDTRGTVFGDKACQGQYNSLPDEAKKQIDAAVTLSKTSGPAALLDAAKLLRAAGKPEIADCLTNLAKTTSPGTGGQPAAGVGAGAKTFTGPCLDLYKGLPASDQANIDSAITAANVAGGGMKGAALLAQYAQSYTNADPTKQAAMRACLAAAAVTMNGGNPLPATDVIPTGTPSGRSIFTDAQCAKEYDTTSDVARKYIDAQVAAAHSAGDGPNGARVLAMAATAFLPGSSYENPTLHACMWAAATAMNNGQPVDLGAASTPASGGMNAANELITQLFKVGATGMPPHLRSQWGMPRGVYGYR